MAVWGTSGVTRCTPGTCVTILVTVAAQPRQVMSGTLSTTSSAILLPPLGIRGRALRHRLFNHASMRAKADIHGTIHDHRGRRLTL